MIFNIYYINFPKVYEIKMMLSNIISLNKEIIDENDKEKNLSVNAKLGVNFMNWFKIGDIEAEGSLKGSNKKKVLETFEIKTTKSIILNDIIEKSRKVDNLSGLNEGDLIQIEKVSLVLENEAELRTVKLFTSGSFKGIAIPGANGLDINNLFNSMFKDYSYKLKGTTDGTDEELLVKIPLTFENEFESSYSVDDLFIGSVSLIGIYKSKIKIDQLKNSFEFYRELGESTNSQNLLPQSKDDEIQESQYRNQETANIYMSSKFVDKTYHYIDLLAIIQGVKIPDQH